MAGSRRYLGSAGRIALSVQLWSLLALATKKADICASINTSSGQSEVWQYQSHGHCGDICRAEDFAFAIVQDHKCWCSDYTPADSTVVEDDECDIGCPGFDEICGGKNLFSYLYLNKKPLGAMEASGHAIATATTSLESETETVQDTVPVIPTSSTGQRTSTTSGNPPPSTVQTVTADGTVRTVTITPTAGTESPNTADMQSKKKSPSTGTIVGIVIGVALGIIALFAMGCFIKIRRANRKNDGTFEVRNVAASGAGVTGVPSGMSQVKGDGPFMSTRGIAAGPGGAAAGAGNRRSRLMPIDPRMDPNTAPGIYVRNKSHESVHTLHDDQDYSRRVTQPRVLRATNPDPDADE